MSEWLKEHAWKLITVTRIQAQRDIPSRNRFSALRSPSAARSDTVNVRISRSFSSSPYTIPTQ
jgi:hypothetical protein